MEASAFFNVKPKMFQSEEDARRYLGVQSTWAPWDDSLPLADAVARTYFWYIPQGEVADVPAEVCGDLQCQELYRQCGLPPLVTPSSFKLLLGLWNEALPCWTVVHSKAVDPSVRLAYMSLLLRDMAQARKLKHIDVSRIATFLETSDFHAHVLAVVRTRQEEALREFNEDAPGPWMTYKYWLHHGNLFERDTQHILGVVFRAQVASRMSNTRLLERCMLCIDERLFVSFTR